MANKPKIEFIESHQAYARDGAPRAATCYVFQVDGRQVTVEVHNSAVMTRDGNLQSEKVRVAAESFLENEAQVHGTDTVPGVLVLGEDEMDLTIKRLAWPGRFPRPH